MIELSSVDIYILRVINKWMTINKTENKLKTRENEYISYKIKFLIMLLLVTDARRNWAQVFQN